MGWGIHPPAHLVQLATKIVQLPLEIRAHGFAVPWFPILASSRLGSHFVVAARRARVAVVQALLTLVQLLGQAIGKRMQPGGVQVFDGLLHMLHAHGVGAVPVSTWAAILGTRCATIRLFGTGGVPHAWMGTVQLVQTPFPSADAFLDGGGFLFMAVVDEFLEFSAGLLDIAGEFFAFGLLGVSLRSGFVLPPVGFAVPFDPVGNVLTRRRWSFLATRWDARGDEERKGHGAGQEEVSFHGDGVVTLEG